MVQCTLYIHSSITYGKTNICEDPPTACYSVMQSDGNSFCGYVVSGSFNKTSWDEDNILDQIYKANMFILFS